MAGTSWPQLLANRKARASEVEAKFDWLEGSLVPMNSGTTADNTYDLGTSADAWKDIYVSGIWKNDLNIPTAKKIYLDGGSDSYIAQPDDTAIAIVKDGTTCVQWNTHGHTLIPSLNRLYFDGGNDTYMSEESANLVTMVCSGAAIIHFNVDGSQGVAVRAGKKFYLDNGNDTYIYESASNELDFVAGGIASFYVNPDSVVCNTTDLLIQSTNKLYLGAAAASGGDTYIYESSANVITFVAGGSVAYQADGSGNLYYGGTTSGYYLGRTTKKAKIVANGITVLEADGATNGSFTFYNSLPLGSTTSDSWSFNNSAQLLPSTDNNHDIGNLSYAPSQIFYYSLGARCFESVKENITDSVPSILFDNLPKTGRFNYKSSKNKNKKYGFIVDDKTQQYKNCAFVNQDKDGNDVVSLHGLIAQIIECVKNMDARIKTIENK